MRAAFRTTPWLALTVAVFFSSAANAHASGTTAPRVRPARQGAVPVRVPLKGPGAKVAVQPFDGPNSEPLRELVVRIVCDRGFHPMTSLPRYEGTGQYPVLARDHRLAAFVTADMEDRGRWQSITFLVWNGSNGSIVGRWTASGPSSALARNIGRGFWVHLGSALRKAQAPRTADDLSPAAPMRIDASNQKDRARFAERE